MLDDPESFKTKEESKKSVLDYILQPDLYPALYKDLHHVVRINYYPPRGDNKEGWDNIDIFGWLGYPMQLKINFLCRDSILAAPIVLDLVLFLDLAQRAGMTGIQEWLSFYFKSPMHAPSALPGARPVHPVDEAEEHAALPAGRGPHHAPRARVLRLSRKTGREGRGGLHGRHRTRPSRLDSPDPVLPLVPRATIRAHESVARRHRRDAAPPRNEGRDMTASKTQPALLGGIFIGVLSALPVVNLGNCCCCLWVVAGGALAVYLLQQNDPAPISTGDALHVGLLAGVVGAVVGSLVSIPMNLLTAPLLQGWVDEVLQTATTCLPNCATPSSAGRRAAGRGRRSHSGCLDSRSRW